jgi:hypothetical protein
MQSVVFNGTTVFNAKNGGTSFIMNGTGAFNPGEEDLTRSFVVVQSDFSGDALPECPVPTINGTSMTSLLSRTSYYSDDGHALRITALKIPTGTGTFTLANCRGLTTLFRVVGITNISTAYSTNYAEGVGGISVNTATNGCAFVAFCNNFGYAGSGCTNTDYWVSSTALGNGSDYQTTGGSIAYNPTGYSNIFGLAGAVSFAYDYY